MASNHDKSSVRAGEARPTPREKAGEVTGATKDKACEAKERAAAAVGHATGKGQDVTEVGRQKAGEAGNKAGDNSGTRGPGGRGGSSMPVRWPLLPSPPRSPPAGCNSLHGAMATRAPSRSSYGRQGTKHQNHESVLGITR